jgi:phosphotriesterase-related protein
LDLLRQLIDAGVGNRILMGNDLGRPSYWKSYGGGPGLDFVLKELRPRMLSNGFTQAELDTLFVHNPSRFFSGEA